MVSSVRRAGCYDVVYEPDKFGVPGGHLERNLFMSLSTWMKQVVVVVSKARASPTAAARNLSFINRIGNRDVANYNKSYDGCSCLIG